MMTVDAALEERLRAAVKDDLAAITSADQDFKADTIKAKIDAILAGLSSDKERRHVIKRVRQIIHAEEVEAAKKLAATQTERTHLLTGSEHLRRLSEWAEEPLRLQKPQGSMVGEFRRALEEGRVFTMGDCERRRYGDELDGWRELLDAAAVFVVEHDWASAFKSAAEDFGGGEVKLPADVCAFEFRVSDRHVIAFMTDDVGTTWMQIAVQVKKGWVLFQIVNDQGEYDGLYLLIANQTKAVAIVLDAEVATAEVVREPYRRNAPPQRGRELPFYSFHVVRLNRRSRPADLPGSSTTGTMRRLHFRRGHWRHYESFKSWIRWCLPGNPELGFVDKEYRL